MQRTLGRACQRLQGNHPRRPDGHRLMELLCDAILALAGLVFVGGLGLIAWGCIGQFEPIRVVAGGALVIATPFVLLFWERLAWEPFEERLSQLS